MAASPVMMGRLHAKQFYLLASVAILMMLATVIYLGPTHQQIVSPWRALGHIDAFRDRQVLEIEGLALGLEFTRPPDPDASLLVWLMNSLQSRFQQIAFPDEDRELRYPECALTPERYAKTARRPQHGLFSWRRHTQHSIVSFAINLRNSEAIIPAQAMALLEAVAHFLQNNNKVYVSIYENDSTDNTRLLLSDLGSALQAIGVDGLWIHSSNMRTNYKQQDRIVMLAEIRNLGIAPLIGYASSAAKGSDTLIFMNDVIVCASDILELVHQQRLQEADMVFGMDWEPERRRIRKGEPGYLEADDPAYDADHPPSTKVARLYDVWVSRGISGNTTYDWLKPGGLTPKSPNETWAIDAFSTESEAIHQRWLKGLAFPAYSGWGGMAAFDASLFTREHLRFRSSIASGWTGGSAGGGLGAWGQLVSSLGYLESDCPGASECEYIARDIWNLRQGRARIVLAPQANTAYGMDQYLVMRETVPITPREGPDLQCEDEINWSVVTMPESVVCMSARSREGVLLQLWSSTNHRYRVDPRWEPSNITD